jgi:PIN domain nuclease of toxin-antitoxin system
MTRALLDTHTLLWAWLSPEKLSSKVREWLENPSNERLVSVVSAMEIATKYRIGKLDVEASLVYDFKEHLDSILAKELPILTPHAILAGSFKAAHRDPFDRTLAAQSQIEGLPLLTLDPAFSQFPIQVFW